MIPDFVRAFGRKPARTQQVDMGQGRHIGPEDVLDGHFRRLSNSASATRTVRVRSDDTLNSAITVLAPDLAPLTDLAEDVAWSMADVQPEAQFRADLHRALEATHRQHAAQRALGTRPHTAPDAQEAPSNLPWLATGLLFLLLVVLLRRRRRRSV